MILFEDTFEYKVELQANKDSFKSLTKIEQCYYLVNRYNKSFDIDVEYDCNNTLDLFNNNEMIGDVIHGIYFDNQPDLKCDLIAKYVNKYHVKDEYTLILSSGSNGIPIDTKGLALIALLPNFMNVFIKTNKPTKIKIWIRLLAKDNRKYIINKMNHKYENYYISSGIIMPKLPSSFFGCF